MILPGSVYLYLAQSFLTRRVETFMVFAILEVVSPFCFCNMIHFTLDSSNFFIIRILRLPICRHSLAYFDLAHPPVFPPSERLVRSLSCFALLDRGANDFLYKINNSMVDSICKNFGSIKDAACTWVCILRVIVCAV